jgi:2-keto-4-pentenoate hydratase/2-oxohepta-3-ene-1,7-dioic acid hydratase in catechol pathway
MFTKAIAALAALALSSTAVNAQFAEGITRLVRFEAENGQIYYGQDLGVNSNGKQRCQIVEGSIKDAENMRLTDEVRSVAKVLSPMATTDMPAFYGIGWNYVAHANEGGNEAPSTPVVFYMNPNANNNPYDPIPIPSHVKTGSTHPTGEMDYESELVIIIGKDCDNVGYRDAYDCILGYTVGNDISARWWQGSQTYRDAPTNEKLQGGQWSYSKGFDKFSPMGPAIVPRDVFQPYLDSGARIKGWVNGELRQNATLNDMIFDPQEIVAFLSQGTTLNAGMVIMTGTPEGVGGAWSEGGSYLVHGDTIRVEMEGIGYIENTVDIFAGKRQPMLSVTTGAEIWRRPEHQEL